MLSDRDAKSAGAEPAAYSKASGTVGSCEKDAEEHDYLMERG